MAGLFVTVKPADDSKAEFTKKLKAMTHTDAVAEVLKLAAPADKAEAELWSGAKVQIVAVVDDFTIASQVTVKTEIRR